MVKKLRDKKNSNIIVTFIPLKSLTVFLLPKKLNISGVKSYWLSIRILSFFLLIKINQPLHIVFRPSQCTKSEFLLIILCLNQNKMESFTIFTKLKSHTYLKSTQD